MGGLSRRAHIHNQIIEQGSPALLLDAGALLFEQETIHASLLPARMIQARGVARAIQGMKYAAVNIAPQDLAAGADFLKELGSSFYLPFLSANLVTDTNQQPLFDPYTIKEINGISVGIIGITAPLSSSQKIIPDNLRILPWQEVLEKNLAEIRTRSEMIILLSSYSEQTNREIAGRFADIHLIIQSGTQTSNKAPRITDNTLITQTAAQGKYVGRLDIDWQTSGRWDTNAATELKQNREKLDRVNWQLGRYAKRYPEKSLQKNNSYHSLLEEQARLSREIARQEQVEQQQQDKLATYAGNFIALDVSLPEEPAIKAMVLETKQMINSRQRAILEGTPETTPKAAKTLQADMIGLSRCQSCHAEQADFWQTTGHAGAWQTLVEAGQQFNQDCLICHVTLPTYDKQTVLQHNLLSGLSAEFRSVSCEACHGPGRQHAEAPDQHSPASPDAQKCLACHTPDQDDDFDFAVKREKIRCPPIK